MSVPIKYCKIRKAVDNNKWRSIHSDMRYNNLWGGFTIYPCDCGKCKPFTKEELKIVNEKLAWNHPNNIPLIQKMINICRLPELMFNEVFQKWFTKK